MFRINGTNISLVRGDTFNCTIEILQDGNPYELQDGDVVRFYLKSSYISDTTLITKEVPSSLELRLNPDDTKELKFGKYVYDIELTFANGDVDTFIQGTFEIMPEVQ